MHTLYRLEKLNTETNEWEFERNVIHKNTPCCSRYERVV